LQEPPFRGFHPGLGLEKTGGFVESPHPVATYPIRWSFINLEKFITAVTPSYNFRLPGYLALTRSNSTEV